MNPTDLTAISLDTTLIFTCDKDTSDANVAFKWYLGSTLVSSLNQYQFDADEYSSGSYTCETTAIANKDGSKTVKTSDPKILTVICK